MTEMLTCMQCKMGFKQHKNSSCVPHDFCDMGSFFDMSCRKCIPCEKGCVKCQENPEKCSQCLPQFTMNETSHSCIAKCEAGTFLKVVEATESCESCSEGCHMCSSKSDCGHCQQGFVLDFNQTAQIMSIMERNQSLSEMSQMIMMPIPNATCKKCPDNCHSCQKLPNGQINCIACLPGFANMNGTCAKQTCPMSSFYDSLRNECTKCSNQCAECTSLQICTKCSTDQFMVVNNTCHDKCMVQNLKNTSAWTFYDQEAKACVPCSFANCDRCMAKDQCGRCMVGHSLMMQNMTTSCLRCTSQCESCTMNGTLNQCMKCSKGYEVNVTSGACVAISCEQNGVFNSTEGLCERCPLGCNNCTNMTNCLECKEGTTHNNRTMRCDFNCKMGQYVDQMTQSCINCQVGCDRCLNDKMCLECKKGSFKPMSDNPKIQKFLEKSTHQCIQCRPNCNLCELDRVQNLTEEQITNLTNITQLSVKCMACAPGFKLQPNNGSCSFERCPLLEMFYNNVTQACQNCSPGCQICQNTSTCDKCMEDLQYNMTLERCVWPNGTLYVSSESQPQNGTQPPRNNETGPASGTQQPPQNESEHMNHQSGDNMNESNQTNNSKQCERGMFFDNQTSQCRECARGCQMCDDKRCLMCEQGFVIKSAFDAQQMRNATICMKVDAMCPMGNQFYSYLMNRCENCPKGCLKCEDPRNCQQCSSGFFNTQGENQTEVCMESCPLGTFSVHDEKGMRCQRCEKDCRVCNEKMCLDCEMGTNLVQHPEGRTLCVRECPAGTFMHMERRMCQPCHMSCKSCQGPEATHCTSCQGNFRFMNETKTCTNPCTATQYLHVNDTCQSCDTLCASCTGQPMNCTSCTTPLLLDKRAMKCFTKSEFMCEAGSFVVEANSTLMCQKCHETCETCTGATPEHCTKCMKGLVRLPLEEQSMNRCLMNCPAGNYMDEDTRTCMKCANGCSQCKIMPDKSQICLNCQANFFQNGLQCVEACPSKTFAMGGKCMPCHQTCASCNMTTCLTCAEGLSKVETGLSTGARKHHVFESMCFNSSATNGCPVGSFLDASTSKCTSCALGCSACTSLTACTAQCDSTKCLDCLTNATSCIQCIENKVLIRESSQCSETCPAGMFRNQINVCMKCSEGCQTCNGPATCTQCQAGFTLLEQKEQMRSSCVKDCNQMKMPMTLFADKLTNTCKSCKPGCLNCMSEQTCDKCRPLTWRNEHGDCSCLFTHQIMPSETMGTISVMTQDISWHKALMNRRLPCSVYFRAMVKADQCQAMNPMGMDMIKNMSPKEKESMMMDISPMDKEMMQNMSEMDKEMLMMNMGPMVEEMIMNMSPSEKEMTMMIMMMNMNHMPMLKPLPPILFLDNFMCDSQLMNHRVFAHDIQDFVDVEVGMITVIQIQPHHIHQIMEKQIHLGLNTMAFMRKGCQENPNMDYMLRVSTIRPMNVGGNNSGNDSQQPPDHDNNQTDNQTEPQYFIKLSTRDLMLRKCEQADVPRFVQIMDSRGFEKGFKSIIWMIQRMPDPMMMNNTMNMSNSTNQAAINTKIQQIMVKNENRLRIDFSELQTLLNEEVPVINLRVHVHAISMEGGFTNESAKVSLVLMNKIDIMPEMEKQLISNTQSFQFLPQVAIQTCEGVQTMKYDFDMVNQTKLMLHCSLVTEKGEYLGELNKCRIPPNKLQLGRTYHILFRMVYYMTHELARGRIMIETEQMTPTCRIKQGSQITVPSGKELVLNAMTNANLEKTPGQWICMMADQSTGGIMPCTEIKIKNGSQPNMMIEQDSLMASQSYHFIFNLIDPEDKKPLAQCKIQVDTVDPSLISLVSVVIKADTDDKSYLSLDKQKYNFICQNITIMSQLESSLMYEWTLASVYPDGTTMMINLTSQASKVTKYLQISKDAFQMDKDYYIKCKISTLVAAAKPILGGASLMFNTRALNASASGLSLVVYPETGSSFTTEFNIVLESDGTKSYQCTMLYTEGQSSSKVILFNASEFMPAFQQSKSTRLPSGTVAIIAVCNDISWNQVILRKHVTVTKSEFSSTQVAEKLQSSSEDLKSVMQTFQIVSENSQSVNTSQKAKVFLNTLNAMLTAANIASDAALLDQPSQLETLGSITTTILSDASLKNNSELLQKSANLFLTVLQSDMTLNMQNGSILIERPKGDNLMKTVQALEVATFQKIAQIAGDFLSATSATDGIKNERKMVVAALLDASTSVMGNTIPGQVMNISAGGVQIAMTKIQKDTAPAIVSLVSASAKSLTTAIKTDDPVFSTYQNLVFKQVVIDNGIMKDTLTDKPLTDFPTNLTRRADSTKTEFKSDVFIVNAFASEDALAVESSFQIKQVEVKNLNTPITFDITVSNLQTAANNLTEIRTECVFMNETSQKWEKLVCSNAQYNGVLSGSTIKCCSPHMTQFAVTQTVIMWTDITPVVVPPTIEIEYSDDNFPMMASIIFGVFAIVFIIIGCILDKTNAMLLFDSEVDPKKKTFFDLRDVPTREANYSMTDPASHKAAEPVSRPMDNERRPPRAGHQVSQDEQEVRDHNAQRQAHQVYEGGSEEDSANEDNQAQVMSNARKNKKMVRKNNSQINNPKVESDDIKKKNSKKIASHSDHDNQDDNQDQNSHKKHKNHKKNKNSDDSDDVSSHGMTKGEVEETQNRGAAQAFLVDNVQNMGPNMDESIDQEDHHVNPNDLSAARPLKQTKKDQNEDRRSKTSSLNKQPSNRGQSNPGMKPQEPSHAAQTHEMTMSFGAQYILVIQVYSRILSILYRDSHHNPRFNKVVASVFQFSLMMLIPGILATATELENGAIVIVTILIMRLVQIAINFGFSNSSFRDQALCRNIVIGVVLLILFVIASAISVRASQMDVTDEQMSNWKSSFIATFFVEIIAIDFVIIPMVISSALTCCCVRCSRRLLNPALSQIRREATSW